MKINKLDYIAGACTCSTSSSRKVILIEGGFHCRILGMKKIALKLLS